VAKKARLVKYLKPVTNKFLTKKVHYVSLLIKEIQAKAKGESVRDKVQTVLDNIRPSLRADGGDIELVDVKDGIVSVKLKGACAGCPMSTMTLKNGIERILKQELSDVKEVIAV
jgi:Fe-S cluster biogenesis protein NfuA